MKIKVFYITLLIFHINSYAQLGKEAWHWEFGYHCSLDFTTGTPVIGTSSINTSEGCASYSSRSTGQLLFYTDGISVWDRTDNPMPNAFNLGGNVSTTQSALIIPQPGDTNIFYLITCDAFGASNGVQYSMIDMTLNGGLGDINTSVKNISLTTSPVAEKLTAVKHHNNIDYWIIDHPLNSNAFNAYLVTSTGINSIPIISHVGTIVNDSNSEYIGYLKASPNGKKIAQGVEVGVPILEIYDFDNSTGQVSNPITINYSSFYGGPYGVSFSPDNSKIYASIPDNDTLYQYDLSSNVSSTIIASQNIIAHGISCSALQIGPDGKIYAAIDGGGFLSVINNPNNLGAACNFQNIALTTLANTSCYNGLPNFIDANDYSNSNSNINEIKEGSQMILIYPNPNKGSFFIDSKNNSNCIIQIYDIYGKMVFTQTINGKNAIDTSSLMDGIYNIIITSSGNDITSKKMVLAR